MHDQGAGPEETHAAVAEMLKSYGIEAPDHQREPDGLGHPWGDSDADLTDQQRQALEKEIQEMKSRGASPLEMQVAVDEQDYAPAFKKYLMEQLFVPAERCRLVSVKRRAKVG